MRVLIASRMNRALDEDAEAFAAEEAIRAAGAEAIRDSEIDWTLLFSMHYGRVAGYASVASNYDHLAMIEGWSEEDGYYLSRGQCTLADAFWHVGKSASVWRDARGHLVLGLLPISNNWGGAFMRARLSKEP